MATDLVGWKGRIIVEGIYEPGDKLEIEPYTLLLLKSVSVIGINGWSSSDFTEAIELLSEKRIDTASIVTHTFPIDNWESAFDMIENRKDEAIKVLLALQQQ
jgi:threonine dehydrogenase-like Zn-dependent dehydrogenase